MNQIAINLAACVALIASSASAELPLGVVAEKPSTGPAVAIDGGFMVPYEQPIPGTEVSVAMVPVPGGEFLLGSPENEPERNSDEGPQRKITVPPFWMAKYETRWAEYRPFMELCSVFERFNDRGIRPVTDANTADAITAPSKLYEPDFTFNAGEDPQLPAVTMTQFSAKQYSKWLSLLTAQFYRLPSEAEWEYACRAGTTTAYGFGGDAAELDAYAWTTDNSDDVTHPVGGKQPNAWGLYDLHGNACEWVLDAYDEAGYKHLTGDAVAVDAINWPIKVFPRVLRGGSALLDATACRSAARRASDDAELKSYDPNTPKSPWWFASDEAQDIGFRLIRPLESPPAADRGKFWDADVPTISAIVRLRIEKEGRGEFGVIDPDLPAAIETLKTPTSP